MSSSCSRPRCRRSSGAVMMLDVSLLVEFDMTVLGEVLIPEPSRVISWTTFRPTLRPVAAPGRGAVYRHRSDESAKILLSRARSCACICSARIARSERQVRSARLAERRIGKTHCSFALGSIGARASATGVASDDQRAAIIPSDERRSASGVRREVGSILRAGTVDYPFIGVLPRCTITLFRLVACVSFTTAMIKL